MQSLFLAFLLFFIPFFTLECSQPDKEFTVLYKGRFRPSEAYARLWLYDFYHNQSLKKKDLGLFRTDNSSALNFLLHLQVFGNSSWKTAPLFWIKSAELKKIAGLESKRDRFSYSELTHAIYQNAESSHAIANYLITSDFLEAYLNPQNFTHAERFELKNLLPGLWVQLNQSDLIVTAAPGDSSWPFLTAGYVIAKKIKKNAKQELTKRRDISEELLSLIAKLRTFNQITGQNLPLEKQFESRFADLSKLNMPSKKIAGILESEYPVLKRLSGAGSLFYALPSRNQGDWLPLNALKVKMYSHSEQRLIPVNNFTLFENDQFENIRQKYLIWEESLLKNLDVVRQNMLFKQFAHALNEAYLTLADKPYRMGEGKSLTYPSQRQLHIESLYYQYPWIEILIFLYTLAGLSLFPACNIQSIFLKRLALSTFILAFTFHTLLLACRSYLLNRPPVSNMFETVIYVPWITTACGLLLYSLNEVKHMLVLISACLSSLILLVILKLADLNNNLENVQAVLDSQFWLMLHVLMIVASYGVFLLGAIISHIYLLIYTYKPHKAVLMQALTKLIKQSMHIGLVLLIPGTILGGVWAAESWGRFWDWDPKESWAFISICTYLIWVHAYRYHRIGAFGLAVGSITGFLSISFTWYGVNYILGTGLHSYGFGSGGDIYYYAFFLIEIAFIVAMLYKEKRKFDLSNQNSSK